MKHALVLLVIYAAFGVLARHEIPDWPFGYDEADYMFAATLGLKANYTDTPTMPIGEFVRLGLTQARGSDLSATIRATNDIVFYRHWHGPLFLYWLLANAQHTASPQILRGLELIFPIVGGLLIYFGCLRVLPPAWSWPAAILCTSLYLWSEAVLRSPELAPHRLFSVCTLACLFLLARMMSTGSRRQWYGAVVFAALAFCTLEVAFVLVITMAVCGHLARKELQPDIRFALKSMALFVGVVLVIWPAALLKLSFVKAYAFMAYLALFRKNSWGTDLNVWQVWGVRFAHSPIEWLIIAAGIAAWAFAGANVRRILLPFALFAALMIAAVFRVNATDPRYMLPFVPALHVLAGSSVAAWMVGDRTGRAMRLLAIALLCVLLFASRAWSLASRPLGGGEHEKAILAWVLDHQLGDKRILVPQGVVPMLHYYFPNASLAAYRDAQSLEKQRAQGGFAAILYPNQP